MALTPGNQLGPYTVTAKIGAGGMGEVYKARDTRLDRTVSINASLTRQRRFMERVTQSTSQGDDTHGHGH